MVRCQMTPPPPDPLPPEGGGGTQVGTACSPSPPLGAERVGVRWGCFSWRQPARVTVQPRAGPGPWCGARRTPGASAWRHETLRHERTALLPARPRTVLLRARKNCNCVCVRGPAGAGGVLRARNPLGENDFLCRHGPPPRSVLSRLVSLYLTFISVYLALSHFVVSPCLTSRLALSRFVSRIPAINAHDAGRSAGDRSLAATRRGPHLRADPPAAAVSWRVTSWA